MTIVISPVHDNCHSRLTTIGGIGSVSAIAMLVKQSQILEGIQ
jgi:hypothetical protein